MKLHGYFRSSAAYRVRIALNLKGLAYEQAFIHLRRDEQRGPEFLVLNPQGLVPALELDSGEVLTQSLAILEYLDETWRAPALLPTETLARARVRSLAQLCAVDIHPLNNLRVLQYLRSRLGAGEDDVSAWYQSWVDAGYAALESRLAMDKQTGMFCHGDEPSMADICLVPQTFNGLNFGLDLNRFPTIRRIYERATALPAFRDAHPANQPDAE